MLTIFLENKFLKERKDIPGKQNIINKIIGLLMEIHKRV